MARPRKNLPPGAREFIMQCAHDGALKPTKLANGLGMTYASFKAAITDNRRARELWEEARAVERDVLVQKLYDRAMEGDSNAARFLLGARHGLNDKDGAAPTGSDSRVTINLPGSMTAKQYAELMQIEEP